jgi:hypothetical protein
MPEPLATIISLLRAIALELLVLILFAAVKR